MGKGRGIFFCLFFLFEVVVGRELKGRWRELGRISQQRPPLTSRPPLRQEGGKNKGGRGRGGGEDRNSKQRKQGGEASLSAPAVPFFYIFGMVKFLS